MSTSTSDFLADLNQSSVRIHTAKEDAFWVAFMGLSEDSDSARADLDAKDIEGKRFLSSPERQTAVRDALAAAEASGASSEDELVALRGWLRTFEAHGIESAEARALEEEIVGDEGELAKRRGGMETSYTDAAGEVQRASSVKLSVMLASEEDAGLRSAAHTGLRDIEEFVLANGYLGLVKKRNRIARSMGAEDYYDWKSKREEGLSKAEIFEVLDELEEATRESAQRGIAALGQEYGADQVTPANIRFLMSGDITREFDPYFPFEKAIERWGQSFAALGIEYRGAKLVLDLVDREGKYENGFMHGPEIAWRENGEFHPARIHFTANAIPGMVGSGKRALETLFHEGGHAAHFANVDMPAPCFGQEFAPTSSSMAETQSMFLDSLVGDADWVARYASTLSGEPMPWELFEKSVRQTQPFAAWSLRSMLTVCYAEKAIYEIPDGELTAERVLAELRRVEEALLFLEGGSPRPVLSIPHLLSGDASASYHGYVLAEVGVYQTRHFFQLRDGYLVDNPKIGPDLREAYWKPGNSSTFKVFVQGLTGEPVTARYLAVHVNRTVDEALGDARQAWEAQASRPRFDKDVNLDAAIRVAHGNETVADSARADFTKFSGEFESWISDKVAANT